MSNRRKAFAGIVVLIVLAAAVGYFYLTKSQSVEVTVDPGKKYRIAGKYYEGFYGDRKLEDIFGEMRRLIENREIEGELAILYYGDPTDERGMVKNFIGILPEPGSEIPSSLEVRNFSPESTITVSIHSHPTVMPRPNKIRKMMEEEATKQGYALDSIFMEKYLGNEDIVVMRHLYKASD
ncbi:MAG: hypothetical protein WBB45_20720 [Cyclobacteriaceae bacterium]